MDDDAIVADKIDGIPHPAETFDLIGHEETTKQVLQQYASGRMHHALLLTGPRGIGKATFALRVASHVFRHPDGTNAPLGFVDSSPNDPIDGKLAARSHPNLLHMMRPWDEKTKKFKTQLTVDVIRLTVPFFGTSRGEEGWRIAIVDAADDMNASAANALLKILEEPPHNTLFFVLSHSPAKVLPTIRSRCQQISMKPLQEDQVLSVLSKFGALDGLSNNDQSLLGALAKGSVRTGLMLTRENGLEIYKSFMSACSRLDKPDWSQIQLMAEKVTARGKEDGFRLLLAFANEFMEAHATGRLGEKNDISSLARWAQVWEKTQNSIRLTEGYNLDKKQVILNLFQDMGEVVRG